MNASDILGLGRVLPVDKLIEILVKTVGRVSKPYFDRKDIDTRAYEIKKLAEARVEEMKIVSQAVRSNFLLTGGIEYKNDSVSISSPKEEIKSLVEPSIEQRVQDRVSYQEIKKQLNLESITSFAVDELRNEEPVTDQPVEEDWANRFFKIAEEISNEEMQALWGRILAGEIKRPKSYSLRTLEVLKNLTKNEAEVFLKFGELSITSAKISFIINFIGEKLLEEKYKLNLNERLLLEELGLVSSSDLEFYMEAKLDSDATTVFKIGTTCVVADRKKGTPKQAFSVLVFTKIGQELLQLIKYTPELDYVQLLASRIRYEGVTVRYGQILKEEGGNISYSSLTDVPLNDNAATQSVTM